MSVYETLLSLSISKVNIEGKGRAPHLQRQEGRCKGEDFRGMLNCRMNETEKGPPPYQGLSDGPGGAGLTHTVEEGVTDPRRQEGEGLAHRSDASFEGVVLRNGRAPSEAEKGDEPVGVREAPLAPGREYPVLLTFLNMIIGEVTSPPSLLSEGVDGTQPITVNGSSLMEVAIAPKGMKAPVASLTSGEGLGDQAITPTDGEEEGGGAVAGGERPALLGVGIVSGSNNLATGAWLLPDRAATPRAGETSITPPLPSAGIGGNEEEGSGPPFNLINGHEGAEGLLSGEGSISSLDSPRGGEGPSMLTGEKVMISPDSASPLEGEGNTSGRARVKGVPLNLPPHSTMVIQRGEDQRGHPGSAHLSLAGGGFHPAMGETTPHNAFAPGGIRGAALDEPDIGSMRTGDEGADLNPHGYHLLEGKSTLPGGKVAEGDTPIGGQSRGNDFLETMMNEVRSYMEGRQKTLRIKLHPEYLGEIEVRVSARGKEISAIITAGRHEVRELLENGLPRLRQALLQKDLVLEDISINLRDDSGSEVGREAGGGYRWNASPFTSDGGGSWRGRPSWGDEMLNGTLDVEKDGRSLPGLAEGTLNLFV